MFYVSIAAQIQLLVERKRPTSFEMTAEMGRWHFWGKLTLMVIPQRFHELSSERGVGNVHRLSLTYSTYTSLISRCVVKRLKKKCGQNFQYHVKLTAVYSKFIDYLLKKRFRATYKDRPYLSLSCGVIYGGGDTFAPPIFFLYGGKGKKGAIWLFFIVIMGEGAILR